MDRFPGRMTRRWFLSLPATVPLATLRWARSDEHHFSYDHVIGTSLDLVVWTSNAAAAERAEAAALEEVHRLTSILNTRDPGSEISGLSQSDGPVRSRELADVLSAYDYWTERTGGIVSVQPRGVDTPRNVDALGKAYIIERAAMAATTAAPGIDGVLLNIGGDIVARGRPCDIALADPDAPYENATPLTRIRLDNMAIATSGTYARGAHLFDARTGQPAALASSGTVVAADAVTANALATTLCLTGAGEGLQFVERTPGAEALRVARDGVVRRTSGFSRLERQRATTVAALLDWPAGYELTVSLTLTQGTASAGGGGFFGRGGFGGRRRDSGPRRPYVAVWVETTSGKLVRVLAFWASKPKYFSELSSFWNIASREQRLLYSTARATREPGKYQLVWDGLGEQRRPTPPGTYRIVVETNQEHGVYAKQAGTIVCGNDPASLTLPATANFETVSVQYGSKSKQA
jgi:thiamine biosynthesis lipoprotein